MIRIAFTIIGGKNWTGGYNYLLNLVRSLAQYSPNEVTPVLFFGLDIDPNDAIPFENLAGVEIVRHRAFDRSRKMKALMKSLLLGHDSMTQRVFLDERIDVCFENAHFGGWLTPLPTIAWFPDFQHRLLPHFFSKIAYCKREIGFRIQAATKRTIMLSSEDSLRACEQFMPNTVGRTHIVRFAVPMPPLNNPEHIRKVLDHYNLPSRYIFMPNQFWQHKNHGLVLDALALLKKQGYEDIVVVASGKKLDPRMPKHFSTIKERITELGLESQFRILGMVPYDSLAPLMRASDALLNPSLFEGWSTTVEEARSAGTPLLLSDIPVHREQAQGLARFFNPHCAESLATALLTTPPMQPSDQSVLALAAEQRMQAFASAFVSVVHSAISVTGLPTDS